MLDRPDWAPASIDIDKPSASRVYDYSLGGSHNFAADRANAIQADARHPETILAHRRVRELLDFDQPVAVMLVAVLHLVDDDEDPAGIVAALTDLVLPGSYVAISHLTGESRPQDMKKAEDLIGRTATPLTVRTRAEIANMFGDLELVDPGLVWVPQWHPDSPDDLDIFEGRPERSGVLGGVGRKR